ncbi:MAG: hypothetical protein AAF152_06865 [Cyanobacteria bacterium P01_A01_bin.114]
MIADLFAQFRNQYPSGSLTTELLMLHENQYIVRATIALDGNVIATAMTAGPDLEKAEERAQVRALALMKISAFQLSEQASQVVSDASGLPTALPTVEMSLLDKSPRVEAPMPLEAVSKAVPGEAKAFEAAVLEVSSSPLLSENGNDEDRASEDKVSENRASEDRASEDRASEDEGSKDDEGSEDEGLDIPLDEVAEISPFPSEGIPYTQSQNQSQPASSLASAAIATLDTSTSPVDLSDIIAQTDVEMARLGWNSQQGREYLEQTYDKRSRQQLTDEELLAFLLHLESQPTPSVR